MAQGNLQEYLIALGVDVDNQGINKIQRVMRMTKSTAFGLTAVLGTLGVLLTKSVLKMNEEAEANEKLAKKQHTTVQAINAQNTALKVMGKTLQEVKKDANLTKTFNELKKIGKELALPTASSGVLSLRSFLLEAEKFRMTMQYAIQWVNIYFLKKIEGPMNRFRDSLKGIRENIMKNMPKIASIVGGALGNFVRLLETLVHLGSDTIKWIDKMPPAVKVFATALGGLWTAMKMSPVAWLIAGITSLLLILEDFYAYKRNPEDSALGFLWKGLEDGTFLTKLGDGLAKLPENIDTALGVFFDVGSKAVEKLIAGITEFPFAEKGAQFSTFLTNLFGAIGKTMEDTKGNDFFLKVKDAVLALVGGMVTFIGTVLETTNWDSALQGAMTGFTNFLQFIADMVFGSMEEDGTTDKKGLLDAATRLAKKIFDSLGKALSGLKASDLGEQAGKWIDNFFIQVKASFDGMDEDNNVFKSILTAAVNLGIKIIDFLLGAFSKIKPEDIADAIASMFQSIFDMISGAISENSPGLGEAGSKIGEFLGKSIAFTGDLIKRLCDNLIEMINDPTNAQKFGEVGSAIVTAIMKGMVGFTDAIMSWIFGKEYDDQKAALIQQQKKNEVGAQVANAAGDKAQNLLGAVYDPKVSLENAWTAAYGYKTAMLPNKFTDQEYDRMGVHGQMMKDAGAVKEPEKLEGYAKDLWSSLFKAMGAAKSPEEYVYAVDAMKKFRDDWNSGKVDKKQVQDEAYAAWDTLTNWADKHPVVFKVVLQDGNGNPITYIRDMLQGWFGPESDYSGVTPDKSIGGVFNQPTRIRVGEGGSDEYVIPTDNPERRDALIMKMFSSMGNSARGLLNRLGYNMGAFDQGAPGMGGKYPAAMFPSGSNVSNSRILNSKTDINVYGSGNAEAAGRAAYRAASVNLVHDAKGVFAE